MKARVKSQDKWHGACFLVVYNNLKEKPVSSCRVLSVNTHKQVSWEVYLFVCFVSHCFVTTLRTVLSLVDSEQDMKKRCRWSDTRLSHFLSEV